MNADGWVTRILNSLGRLEVVWMMAAEMESQLVETRAIAVREIDDRMRNACRHVD